jgi:isoquinoline 1-oxidoreductase beta subunit
VLQVFEIPARGYRVFTAGGIVVVAKSTWAALQGRKALDITWNPGPNSSENTAALHAQMRKALENPPEWCDVQGADIDKVPAAKHVESTYEFPFLSHACMEPMNATIHLHDGKCEAWCPSQGAEAMRTTIAKELEIPETGVTVHTTFMGGGFGRRYQYDFPTEAAQIARHVSSPVQLVWTREDDMTHDFYRPAGMRRMRGNLDAQGNVVAWSDYLVDTAIDAQWAPPEKRKPDGSELPEDLVYPIPNVRKAFSLAQSAVPRAWWRSVSHSFHGLAIECFIDELAHAANQDPYEFRRRQLLRPPANRPNPASDRPPIDRNRLIAVLDLAAKKADWGKPLGANRGRGIACTSAYAYLAQVAEVTVNMTTFASTVRHGGRPWRAYQPQRRAFAPEGGMLFHVKCRTQRGDHHSRRSSRTAELR